jgi:MFS family permease
MQTMKGLMDVVKRNTDAVPRPLLVVSAAVALSLLGDQMLYVVLPVVHEAIGVPVTSIGLLLSANRLVRLLTNSLAGYITERCGRQWPFVLALLLGGLTTIAYGVLYGVWAFLIARLLWGTAWSFIRIEGLSTVLDVASEETRGRYMGFFQAISRLGSAVAMFSGGILADVLGFRITFVLFGGLTCLAAPLAYAEMTGRRAGGAVRTSCRATPTLPGPQPEPAMRRQGGTRRTARDWDVRWRMLVASLGTFSTFLVIGGLVSATLGYTLRTRFGPTPALGSLTVGIASLTGFLLSSRGFLDLGFAPFAGYLADRWGRHRMILWAMPIAILMVLALALLPSLVVVIGVIVVMFAAGTALNVAFNAVAGDVAPPERRGVFLSWFVTCQDLGAAVGPLVGYWIGPAFGLVWLYLCGALVLTLACLLYLATFAGSGRGVVALFR